MKIFTDDQKQVVLLLRFRTLSPSRTSNIFMTYKKIEELTGIKVNIVNGYVQKIMKLNKGRRRTQTL